MTLNMTTFDAALKSHYTTDRVVDLCYTDHPLLAMVPKMTRFGGKNLPIPIKYGNTHGRSVTFATAQSLAGNASVKVEDFVLTRVKDYAMAHVDGETMDASQGDANAFMDAAAEEFDGAFESISASLAHALYRNGTGVKGTIATTATVASTTVELATAGDIVHFEVGMCLEVWDVTGTAIIAPSSNAAGTLTGVNRDAASLTLATNWSTVYTGIAVSDQLLQRGDGEDGGSALNRTKVSGLDAWLPSSAPTSTAFFGVDRSVDTSRLGGIRSDGSSKDIEEAYIDGLTRAHREGGKPTVFFTSYEDWANLDKALGAKKVVEDINLTQKIGFRGLQIVGPKGTAVVVPDQDCPAGVAYGLDMRYVKLYSLGMAPRMLSRDGNRTLRLASSDGVEARIGYYAQLGMRAPGFNVRLTLPT